MYTAQEAREKSERQISSAAKSELNEIEQNVIKAIEKGEMEIFVDGWISQRALYFLKDLGYSVTPMPSQSAGDCTKITW